MHVSLVTPSYNDAQTAKEVLQELFKQLRASGRKFEIVVVDDESRDGTVEILKQFARNTSHIRLFFHEKNQGMAKTFRELNALAKKPLVVQFSLDGEWDPFDVIRLITAIEEGGYDMVLGVRQDKSYGWARKLVSHTYNTLTRLIFGVSTFDAGSIKATKKIVLQKTPCISRGVFEEAERIIRATKMGYRVGTIPILYRPAKKAYRLLPKVPLIAGAIVDVFRLWRSLR